MTDPDPILVLRIDYCLAMDELKLAATQWVKARAAGNSTTQAGDRIDAAIRLTRKLEKKARKAKVTL